jgi:hypothetical protein
MEETNCSGETYTSAVARILGTPARETGSLENKTQLSIIAMLLGMWGMKTYSF